MFSILADLRPLLALRLAARSLRRDLPTTLLATGILALGLALPATFASFLTGALRPLPVPDGERVVRVDVVQPRDEGRSVAVLPAELEGLRGVAGLEGLGGFRTFAGTLVDRDRAAVGVSAAALTPEVLTLLRIQPEVGRLPAPGEAGVLLLGHRVWSEIYESDPDVLGRSVTLDGATRTVVGVMPAGFGFPYQEEAWVPVAPGSEAGLELVGRLAPGSGTEGVAAALSARWAGADPTRAQERTGGVVQVEGFTAGRGEGGEAVAFVGLVLVALALLLIACANVANLLLVRASRRVRALGIQTALGAGRLQIGFQLLSEAFLVALLGGAVGLLLAWGAIGTVDRLLAGEHFGYYWMRLALDGPVVAFVSTLVVGTALVSGILPVVRVLSADVQRVLKEEGAGVGGDGAWSRGFVTLQLALSCAALVAAGLTGRGLAQAADFGATLPGEEVLVASVDLAPAGATPVSVGEAREALAGLPGVRRVAFGLGAPGFRERWARVEVEGVGYERPQDREVVQWNGVEPGYFSLFDVALLRGRLLTSGDAVAAGEASPEGPSREAGRVAVVSRGLAERAFPGGEALGRRLRIQARGQEGPGAWHTVVGVVEELDLGAGEEAGTDRLYLPLSPAPTGPVMALVGTQGPALGVAPRVREELAGLGGGVPVWEMRTLADAHDYIVRVPRTLAGLAVAGGLAGLLVAAVGLYGLLAFRVRERRRELGVRLALGADGRRLAREVLRGALGQLLPAVAVGLGLAWLAAPVLSALLVGTDPRGVGTYVGVAAAFLLVGGLAALRPALAAAAVDPARALKSE